MSEMNFKLVRQSDLHVEHCQRCRHTALVTACLFDPRIAENASHVAEKRLKNEISWKDISK